MIVAIAGLKGGIGKTLIALHLAGEALAREQRVLLADADVQRSALTWADLAVESQRKIPDVVLLEEGEHGLPVLRVDLGPEAPRQSIDALHELAQAHELTLIDCPPRGDIMTRAAMMIADLVVLPTGPAPTDFWALSGTVQLVRVAQSLRPGLPAVLLLNGVQPRQRLSASARGALASLELPVLATTLGRRTAFAESIAVGMTVASFAPKGDAAEEIRKLLTELAGWPLE